MLTIEVLERPKVLLRTDTGKVNPGLTVLSPTTEDRAVITLNSDSGLIGVR